MASKYKKIKRLRHTKLQDIEIDVSLAENILTQEIFILKTQDFEYGKSEEDLIQKCKSNRIITINEAFKEDNNKYVLVLPYLKGGDFSKLYKEARANKTRCTQKKVVLWMNQCVEALEVIHNQNIIHRDIKPSNILLDTAHRNITLIDFGVSFQVEDEYPLTIAGTKGYMAPEQMVEGIGYDYSVDIFGMGITFFEIMFLKKYSKFKWPKDIEYSPELKNLISEMTNEKFYDRPSLREIRDILLRIEPPEIPNVLFKLHLNQYSKTKENFS